MPDGPPDEPEAWKVTPPSWPAFTGPGGLVHLQVPAAVRNEIRAAHRARHRGDVADDDLGAHEGLARLKLAAAFKVLDRRAEMTDEDCQLAARLIKVSNRARESIQAAVAARGRADNLSKAHAAADREVVKLKRLDQSAEERCKRAILRKLRHRGRSKQPALYKACRGSIRGSFNAALDALVTDSVIVHIPGEDGAADEY
jgi:hypothetical protein